jgi:hypothetical protein
MILIVPAHKTCFMGGVASGNVLKKILCISNEYITIYTAFEMLHTFAYYLSFSLLILIWPAHRMCSMGGVPHGHILNQCLRNSDQ